MMKLIVKLALAQVFNTSQQKSLSIMVKLSYIALTIGSFALTLVVGIMNGFQKETSKKLQGIHADIIMKSSTGALDYKKLIEVINHEFIHDVKATSPQAIAHALITNQEQTLFSPLSLCIGIDPTHEPQVTTLFNTLCNSQNKGGQIADKNILIGVTAARTLALKEGDLVNILYLPEELQSKKITLQESSARIGGTFKTGIEEFDTSIIFCNLDFFQELFTSIDVSQIVIKCHKDVDIDHCVQRLKARFQDLEIYTWKDLYPALVSALELEKYAAFIILTLCALIAAINCMALIFMYITQKKMDIAILKTLGMSENAISSIFILIGSVITLGATASGIMGAIIVGYFIQKYPLITLPDAYYVEHIPVSFDIGLIAAVFTTLMILGFFASLIPSRRIQTFSVAHLLKFGAE